MGFLSLAAMFVQRAARRQQSTSWLSTLRHLGVLGLFVLAILDSSPLPTFGGTDILTALLAARHRDPWYYYAITAAVGSTLGAFLTYRVAHRAGAGYLRDKFGERKVGRLLELFQRWGTGILTLSAAVPIPSPTAAFFAAAGVLNYPKRTFLIVVGLSRSARYMAIAFIASRYGRQFIRALRNPSRYYGVLILIAAGVLLVILLAIMVRRQWEDAKQFTRKTNFRFED